MEYKIMSPHERNPFPPGDPDRFEIWEILVNRDIAAFVEADWSKAAEDFQSESFVGYSGSSNPDHWRITFPSLDTYRDEWLRQASEFQKTSLVGEDTRQFLFKASILRDIEICDDVAMAQVTSSCLCKNPEGAGFPFQVESVEDGVDDSVHGLHIDETYHGPGAASDFDEAALDDIGGAQLSP